MLNNIIKIKKFFEAHFFRLHTVFRVDVEKQKQYLAKFPEPTTNLQRSFFQYKCQAFLQGNIESFLCNLFAIPMLLLLYMKLGLKDDSNNAILQQSNALFIKNSLSINLLSEKLRKKYNNIVCIDKAQSMCIDKEAKEILKELRHKYPFSFLFHAKCMVKMATYAAILKEHKTEAVIVSGEYSFTSSLLTQYCRKKGVQHINIMHGEKVYDITDSFFVFDQCYIWDEFYEALFLSLRADKNKFIRALPEAIIFKNTDSILRTKSYTYYLGGESKKELNNIYIQLQKLAKLGIKGYVRPHPIYTDMRYVESIFEDIEVELPNAVEIEQSILSSKCVMSLSSTVLFQAYNNGVDVIVDNISNPEQYERLKNLDYIMLKKQVRLLSDVLVDEML